MYLLVTVVDGEEKESANEEGDGDIDIQRNGDKCASHDAALKLSARWSFADMNFLGRHRCT